MSSCSNTKFDFLFPYVFVVSFTNFDDVKLQGSSSQNDGGRLEYFKDSQWHTVCSAGFDQDEANLVCRRLGYSSAERYGNATSLE